MLMLVSITQQKAFLYRNGIRIGVSAPSAPARRAMKPRPGCSPSCRKTRTINPICTRMRKNNAAAMPYMQRLTWDGIALHSGNLPGYPASHGCVRMPDGFAQRLFAETELGMTVIVSNDKVASPEKLADPTVFAQSMDADGKTVPVEPLSDYEDLPLAAGEIAVRPGHGVDQHPQPDHHRAAQRHRNRPFQNRRGRQANRSAARPMWCWTASARKKAVSCPTRWS